MRTWPAKGDRGADRLRRVDLPEPDGPMMETICRGMLGGPHRGRV